MAKGVVKWFDDSRGYGFIAMEGDGRDVFAHFSAILMDGYKTLRQGQRVVFDLVEGPKGLQAARIRVTGPEIVRGRGRRRRRQAAPVA